MLFCIIFVVHGVNEIKADNPENQTVVYSATWTCHAPQPEILIKWANAVYLSCLLLVHRIPSIF